MPIAHTYYYCDLNFTIDVMDFSSCHFVHCLLPFWNFQFFTKNRSTVFSLFIVRYSIIPKIKPIISDTVETNLDKLSR